MRHHCSRTTFLLSGIEELFTKASGQVSMAVAINVSRLKGVTVAPPNQIIGVSEAFRSDTKDMKLRRKKILCWRKETKYLPIEGLAASNKVTADNAAIQQGRIATVQGLLGTGSLRLAAAIQRYFPGTKVLISSPTRGNHENIFNDARVP